MKVKYVRSEKAADNIYTFYFSAESKPHYVAGQFTELWLPHDNKDSRGDKRFYTLSSAPSEDLLAITTKFAAQNGSSFKAALRQLKPGTVVDMASPMGDFVLPKDPSIPLTFVAGGIGATPFHSMVQFCADTNDDRPITLLYAANSEGEVAFRKTFGWLGGKFHTLVGEKLSADKILGLVAAGQEGYIYLSGPEPMIEALVKELRNAGVDRRRIQTDFFPGYTTT